MVFFNRLKVAMQAFVQAWRQSAESSPLLDVPAKVKEQADTSHLRLLSYLQQSGRLIDFFKEDITSFTDAQVGAAARKIHRDCADIVEELVAIRPLRDEAEGAVIQIPKGYNPAEVKLVGQIKGEAPFKGVLVHRGWKAHKRSLPKKSGESSAEVVCPAEVEVKM